MSKWKEVIIGDHIDLISGFAFKSADFITEKVEGSLPVIKIKNVANGDVNLKDVVYHKFNKNLEKFLLKEGDVLIAMTGNHPQAETQVVGDVSRYKQKEKSLLNQRVGKLIVRDDTNLDFIYYLFKSDDVRFYLANQSSGSANQANISKSDILGLNLTIPLPNEQTAIASILSSLDNKIDLLHRQNATFEKMAETLFRQWFVEEAKEEWEKESLGNIIEIQRGISYSGSSLCEKTEGIPMHNLNSIDINGSYKYEGIKYYKGKVKDNQILKPGDLLIINTDITQDNRIIGWPIFVPNEFEYSVSTHHLYSAQLKNQNVSKLYLYYLLRHKDYREELANAANGTTVSMLSKAAIEGINIKMPPKEKRILFESQVSVFLKKQSENQSQIVILTSLRDTLLPKLMSGEVRVTT